MIDALASVHAWWWDHEALDEVRERSVEADLVRLARELDSRLPRFLDFLGDRLSTKARATYELVVPGALPLLAERAFSGHHLTLVHGDAHFLGDYRLFALRNLLIPPTQWATGLAAYIWWGHLERALLTAEDLGALELL
jgi:hypothetical protein